MYDPIRTLEAIDDHQVAVLLVCGAAMLCNYAWFFAAFRQARRDRVYAIPIPCSLLWLAGDSYVVLHVERAFQTYDHWFLKLFWAALLVTVAFELLYLAQTVRYGRDELLPSAGTVQFGLLLGGAAAATLAVFWSVQSSLEDDLHILYFHVANVAMPFFYVPILLRRGTTAGTTRFIWGAYLAMATCWFSATTLFFGDDVRGPATSALWAVCTGGCLAVLWALGRLPAPATAAEGLRTASRPAGWAPAARPSGAARPRRSARGGGGQPASG
ncbi:hypothetical protein [Conexibacter sp. SYSU D00693]|uniref:hypothetical protein n=1 Tax=Conexibacter sp. SYSU D00693 TaxID=2812560 RepID=UPI00196B7878|nr:hypothetical protein [Conexibacter sp. SYSU D00693]